MSNQEPERVEEPVQEPLEIDKEKLLTMEDIEKVTGFKGVQGIPHDPSQGAGGDLNFALADGEIFLMVQIQDSSMYDTWKETDQFYNAPVSGVGDEAFNGPQKGYQHVLMFRSGSQAFSLSSFFNFEDGGKPYLTQEQLSALAKVILSCI